MKPKWLIIYEKGKCKMAKAGVVRPLEVGGRIVIESTIRSELNIVEGTPIRMMVDDIGDIILEPITDKKKQDTEIGTIRKVDKTGRFVITADIRRRLELETKSLLEMNVKDGKIILRKYGVGCIFCDSNKDISNYKNKKICYKCSMAITNKTLRKIEKQNSEKYIV